MLDAALCGCGGREVGTVADEFVLCLRLGPVRPVPWCPLTFDVMATHRSQVMISLVALVLPCLNHINTTCQHLIILKEPSAGSTWFTEELNGITGVHLIPQLFTSRDIGNLTSAKAWKRMMD